VPRSCCPQGRSATNSQTAVWKCRADSIVRDAELVRASLVPKNNHDGRWSLLGQSFGGFCCLTYLSIAPQGEQQGYSRAP
jgi:hypothetical protein